MSIHIRSYFELSADFLRLESDRYLLAHFKVPARKNFHSQILVRFEDLKVFSEGFGQPVKKETKKTQYNQKRHNKNRIKA